MIRKKLPDGTGLLKELPTRAKSTSEDDDAADKEYCAAIDKVNSYTRRDEYDVATRSA